MVLLVPVMSDRRFRRSNLSSLSIFMIISGELPLYKLLFLSFPGLAKPEIDLSGCH
jgi:hypothetical protein